jgi:hypothetical protein
MHVDDEGYGLDGCRAVDIICAHGELAASFLLTDRSVGRRKMREREQEGTKYAGMRGIVLGHSLG